MKFEKIRSIVIAAIFLVFVVGVIAGISNGTLCGYGWSDIAILCPLGALLSMISARALIPRAVVSIVVVAVALLLFGRFFCGWVCPVSLIHKVRDFFKPSKTAQLEKAQLTSANQEIATYEIAKAQGHDCTSCGMCAQQHKALDSRHAVLGGTLLASAIFGFPVFCLVCPVGLSFATIVLLVGLFGAGDLNLSLLFVPVFLIVELFVLKKWCTRFCPISALMNFVARFSKTGLPEIDNSICLETSQGIACSQCASVCKYDINLRHPEYGELPVVDCARCMECADVCPTQAIHIVPVNKKLNEPFEVQLATANSTVDGRDIA